MNIDRRYFLTSSTFALAGAALARVPMMGQTQAQAPPVPKFEDIRRNVGIFTRQGR